jgi:hypothetical protein
MKDRVFFPRCWTLRHELLKHDHQAFFSENEPTHRDRMFRRCGVGSYRGGQSLGNTEDAAYHNPNSDSDTHCDPDSYAAAHSDPDGYTNGNSYVYADANSVTRALCTRCQCGH